MRKPNKHQWRFQQSTTKKKEPLTTKEISLLVVALREYFADLIYKASQENASIAECLDKQEIDQIVFLISEGYEGILKKFIMMTNNPQYKQYLKTMLRDEFGDE